jgi:hypothetical protein
VAMGQRLRPAGSLRVFRFAASSNRELVTATICIALLADCNRKN